MSVYLFVLRIEREIGDTPAVKKFGRICSIEKYRENICCGRNFDKCKRNYPETNFF